MQYFRGNPLGKCPIERSRRGWENNTKANLMNICCEDVKQIILTQDSDQRWTQVLAPSLVYASYACTFFCGKIGFENSDKFRFYFRVKLNSLDKQICYYRPSAIFNRNLLSSFGESRGWTRDLCVRSFQIGFFVQRNYEMSIAEVINARYSYPLRFQYITDKNNLIIFGVNTVYLRHNQSVGLKLNFRQRNFAVCKTVM